MSDSEQQTQPAGNDASIPQERLQIAVGERYRIERRIGEGGMATVFLAEDLKHHRKVAVKVLQEMLAHTIGIRRFLQEIEVVARLQHPHLLTLIDSGDVDGLPYYIMPYVEGQSLKELLDSEPRLPIERAVAIAREVADGLQFAHEHGVVHRDIKPSNILMSGGHAIVADFGIATALEKAAVGRLTETGISLGSPTYMSPEQASGEKDLDARTDVYSLGCVLYEMLCGEPPIDDPSMQQVVTRKLTGRFTPVRERRPDVPIALEKAIHTALSTTREGRFGTMRDFADAMARSMSAARPASKRIVLARAAVILVVIAALAFWYQRERRTLWATQRLGEIERLASGGQFASAFDLAHRVGAILPGDTTLKRMQPRFADYVRIVTAPAGARVYRQRLDRPETSWELIGTTPLDSVPMPKYGLDLVYRLRIEHEGYRTVDALPNLFATWAMSRGVAPIDTLRMDPADAPNADMVRIPGWSFRDTLRTPGDTIRLADYHIGRTEVTNREYKRFVDAGGYEKQEYWTHPFVRDGRELSRSEAIGVLRDASGQPGPSTWSGGTFPEGQGDYPVGGVSWYEAAAYARFAGKQLPTSLHWLRASLRHAREANWIYTPTANLSSASPRRVGQGVMNPYGLHDVAGNVREWCLNPIESGRLTRGAGWEDAEFFVGHLIPKPEFDRSPSNGFRLASYSDHDTTIAHLAGPITRPAQRDYTKAQPVSDAEFRVFTRLFDYDSLPLDARTDSSGIRENYRWERVSFNAPYGRERMGAYLLLPKDLKPPFQPVIYWPGSGALSSRTFRHDGFGLESILGFLPRGGRALIVPVFKGAFERDDSTFSTIWPGQPPTQALRDLTIQWIKDLRRTVDYLETRPDMQRGKLGFYGLSWGGQIAPMALTLEPRIGAAVLYTGGLWPSGGPLPEIDPVNYLPRTRTPVLLMNGRHDVVFPHVNSQLPFFERLGTPAADKKHVVFPTGHSVPQTEMVRETLAWYDKYLGPARKP